MDTVEVLLTTCIIYFMQPTFIKLMTTVIITSPMLKW